MWGEQARAPAARHDLTQRQEHESGGGLYGDLWRLRHAEAAAAPRPTLRLHLFHGRRVTLSRWRLARDPRQTRSQATSQNAGQALQAAQPQDLFWWTPRALRYAPLSIRRRADLSIWIDGSFQIKTASFVRDMRAKLGDGDWAMFVHPDRNCIYEEASISLQMRKYRDLPIAAQADAYRATVPPHGGLYVCGTIVRREPVTEPLKSVHALWWAENIKRTYQDQISLPFVLRSVGGCDPIAIPDHQRENQWFEIGLHHSDD